MDTLSTGIRDFIFAIRAYLAVPAFIRKHRLWNGFFEHKLVVLALVLVSLLFGFVFFSTLQEWWSQLAINDPLDVGVQAASLVGDLASSGYEHFYKGAYKYAVLILMELLIFHMALRTNELLKGRSEALTPGLFVTAQVRMIKVSIFVFIMELMAKVVLSIVLGVVGMTFLKTPLLFVAECFFLGFALIDNYNEINHMGIRESYRHTLHFPGASIGIGLILYVLIMIPFLGPILGPMTGAVAATLIMHQLSKRHDDDPLTNPSYEL